MESVLKNFPTKVQDQDSFTGEFYQTSQKILYIFFCNSLKIKTGGKKIEEEGMLPNSFNKVSITNIEARQGHHHHHHHKIIGQHS